MIRLNALRGIFVGDWRGGSFLILPRARGSLDLVGGHISFVGNEQKKMKTRNRE